MVAVAVEVVVVVVVVGGGGGGGGGGVVVLLLLPSVLFIATTTHTGNATLHNIVQLLDLLKELVLTSLLQRPQITNNIITQPVHAATVHAYRV